MKRLKINFKYRISLWQINTATLKLMLHLLKCKLIAKFIYYTIENVF